MKAKKVETGYFIRLDKGEEAIKTLTDFIAQEKIPAGVITGIGALTDIELGYFERGQKQYIKRRFEDVYELLSLTGNISYSNGNPTIHAHCILGDADYQLIGGHFFSGTVAVTGEIYVRAFKEQFKREPNPEFELKLLAF